MTRSLLRKKKNQPHQPPSTSSPAALRHSLSLPDLTTPLLDPASWEELPQSAFIPSSSTSTPSAPSAPFSPRPRKTSIVSHGTPVQFHRPFTPWQVVNNPDSPPQDGAFSPGDFRTSRARWGKERDSMQTVGTLASGLGVGDRGWRKKRGKSKALGRLNVVVVGTRGVGKTSFVRLLVDSLEYGRKSRHSEISEEDESAEGPPAEPTPRPIGVTPTTRLSSRVVHVSDETYDRTTLRLIDTPGLAAGTGAVEDKERERGVAGLLRLMEDRFAEVMREESRVVRRATRGEDDLVHLVLYLIDARSVLHPEVPAPSVDWSAIGVFDAASEVAQSEAQPVAPALAPADIEVIRRLSLRANVLPVLAHTDSLTIAELDSCRAAVRSGLAGLPGAGFGIFGHDEDDGDRSKTPTPDIVAAGKSEGGIELRDPRPPTPASTVASDDDVQLPYAIFNPEVAGDTSGSFTRRYASGVADVMAPEQSDFIALRDAILDTHLKALRTSTREMLYERFRTEKLLEKQKIRGGRDNRLSE